MKPYDPTRVPLTGSKNPNPGILYQAYLRRDIEQWQWRVAFRDSDGNVRSKTFFIGTENTYTRHREKLAYEAAMKFRKAYELWRKQGGIHPINTAHHIWRAKEH